MSKYSHQEINLDNKNNAHTKVIHLVGKKKKVLDFGCSSGYLDKALRDKFNCTVTGIEVDKKDARLAKKNCEKVIDCDIEGFEWEQKLKGQKFDVFIFADVLEHLKNPLDVLRRAKKFLRPNGEIIVSIPNMAHISVRLELLLGQLEYEKLGILDDTHLHFYTKTSAAQLLKEAGYYITKIDFTVYDFTDEIIKQFLEKVNMKYTLRLRRIFNRPEAIALQYIFKARASKPKVYRPSRLSWIEKPIKIMKQQIIHLEEELQLQRALIHELKATIRDAKKLKKIPESSIFQRKKRISQLESELSRKGKELNWLFSKLNKIYHSRTWIWSWIYKEAIGLSMKIIREVVPAWLRKKVKAQIGKQFAPRKAESQIDEKIKEEWQDWKEKRKPENIDVINFGIIAYDYRFQRPQHLATQLAKRGHRVFYIEHEFMPFRSRNSVFAPIKVEKKEEGVYKVIISASQNLFIYREVPSEEDKKIILASLRTLLKEAKIVNPVAKIDHPFWANLLKQISMPVIYDCMDEHGSFKETGKQVEGLEKLLFKKSELVITSSSLLEKKAKTYNPKNLLVLKNAGEFKHFAGATKRIHFTPNDLNNLSRPIIGYYGAIAEWFDTGILEKLANDFKEASIVLVGRVNNSQVERLTKKHPNIHALGEKPYGGLPVYLQEFDVCTIPFVINDLIKATNPVKIYEYFAAGKPVVTTDIPELREYKNLLYLSKNPSQFSKNIQRALEERDESLVKKRQQIAKQNTWEMRGKVLNKFLMKNHFPKVSVIVLVFNEPKMTKKCLESVLNRSFYPNLELVIVDNGSNKATIEMLKEFSEDSRVKLILNKKNLGFAAGNNIGMKKSTGEYLIILNNDTKVTPGWIERLIFHVGKRRVGLVGPVTNEIGNEAKIEISYDPENNQEIEKRAARYTYLHWGETLKLRNIAAFCWALNRKLYDKIGGFDERFGRGLFEDDDYCLRVKKKGLEILCADDVFVHHYGGGATKWGTPKYKKLFEENKKKFEEKWNTKWQPHKYRKGVI